MDRVPLPGNFTLEYLSRRSTDPRFSNVDTKDREGSSKIGGGKTSIRKRRTEKACGRKSESCYLDARLRGVKANAYYHL